MRPIDLELPEKFDEFRKGQLEIAARINVSDKYAFLLDAPTGIGKSLIAATVQRLSATNLLYVCTTKQLQDQLLNDFPYAKTVKGRGNYACLKYENMFPEISAEECTHKTGHECEFYGRCPYIVAKREALHAPIGVLNTAYFLSEANYVGMFSDSKMLVIDEFDTVEDQLMNFIQVVITQRQISRLQLPSPRYKTKFESWIEWANQTLHIIEPELGRLNQLDDSSSWSPMDFKSIRRMKELTRLVSKLRFFVSEVDKNWIWYPGSDKWVFKPVWVSKYALNAIWKHTKKVLGMSATILDPRQVALNTGLAREGGTYNYRALPSPFPKDNRPVYFEPCADIVTKQLDTALPLLAKAVQRIMNNHPGERILIHTVSYKVRNFLLNKIQSDRFITHSAVDRAVVLEKFKTSDKPYVLLSPSMDRGVDLPDVACRVVIIAKVPYGDLGDAQVNKRVHASKDGENWYMHKTVSKIIQMSGRAVRSSSDHAITYILDRQFEKIYSKHKRLFPEWFTEALIM